MVIKLNSSFKDKRKLYIALEYSEGGSFAEIINLKIEMSFEDKVFFIAEMVTILEILHDNGIAHRDFKPDNLMLTKNNHLQVIDFGTAKFVGTED